MTELIIKAYEVALEFTKDEKFIEIVKLNKQIDQLYPNEIKSYEKAKEKYQDVLNTGGTYHPDYKEVSLELSKTKTHLYEQKEVSKYIELERAFEIELNEFIMQITEHISKHIPSPNAFGIVKKGGSCHVG